MQMTAAEDPSESWMPMGLFPPETFETFEVRLPDGSVQRAFWTGQKWLSRGGATVAPASWRIPALVAG